ncbi:MAG: universal stress protein [Gammaproteobacteria bacterium]|nr:universal stress protein [Gammaproteobacteria bacterium]
MHHYHNPLYICHGAEDETEGLKQALSLARNNEAPLKVLVVNPEFPQEFTDYQKKYTKFLLAQVETSIKSTKEAIKLEEGTVDISIELIGDKHPTIKIIQYVLQHSHDLIIKEAEASDSKVGFKAIDMSLLRKCPIPVWLCRPIKHSHQYIQVAVAIDPISQEPAAHDLSIRMLKLSRSFADNCSGELHIVSCWDYEFEEYIRGNVWTGVTDDERMKAVNKVQHEHRSALEKLIKKAGISGTHHVHHQRGRADELIPTFVTDKKIDILVMGTVARTGIPGFMIGNTAENIVQKLTCSLMALKPNGFVSPVKAY